MRELEKENRELRRANEILKSAAIFMWNRRLCGLDRSA
jgi:transposase-like protein